MGAHGTLIIELFALCFKKLNKEQTKKRIIILGVIGIIALFISIIFFAVSETKTDREAAWMFLWFYLLFFGWRLVTDIVLYLRGKLKDNNETDDKTDTTEKHSEKKSNMEMTTIGKNTLLKK